MTTLKDYLRDLVIDAVNHTAVIGGSADAPEIELPEEGLENLLDDYIKLIEERLIE